MKKLFIATILLATSNMAFAGHYCPKPVKPFQFTSEYQYNRFINDVNEYQGCISNYVETESRRLNQAIENNDITSYNQSKNNIENAIDEWNSFVQYDLN